MPGAPGPWSELIHSNWVPQVPRLWAPGRVCEGWERQHCLCLYLFCSSFWPDRSRRPESLSLSLLFVIPEGNLLLPFVCHSERSEESPHLSLFRFARHSELRSESPSLPLPVLLFVIPAGNLLLSLPVFARHSGVARISVVRLCFCLILLLS